MPIRSNRVIRNNSTRQQTARLIHEAAVERRNNKIVRKPTTVIKAVQNNIHVTLSPRACNRPSPNILITGGIGDFIAVESFMTDSERNEVRQVFLATRAAAPIKKILESGSIFPKLQSVISLHDDWKKIFCVVTLEHFREVAFSEGWSINFEKMPQNIDDYSIAKVFPEAMDGKRVFNKSSIFKFELADISKFSLPEDFVLVQPYSPNDRHGGGRDYTDDDWDATLRYLEKKNKVGVVVLPPGDDFIPEHRLLINLRGKTDILEALEISKKCRSYVGIDSCFVPVVTKFLDNDKIIIKTSNKHFIDYIPVYCAPKNVDFPFLCYAIRNLTNNG